jgi:hypothetical protein
MPTPLATGEARLLHRSLSELGSKFFDAHGTLSGKVDAMSAGIALDMGSMRGELVAIKSAVEALSRAVTQIAEREQVTGSYMLTVANMAGRAEGAASKAKVESLPPAAKWLARALTWAGESLVEHWAVHLLVWAVAAALVASGAVGAWLAHHWKLLP